MVTKKHMEDAARIAQAYYSNIGEHSCVVNAFVTFFRAHNPHFDEARFTNACLPPEER